MKCDSCRHKGGEILANDECGGGTYFEYCAKGHWEGSGLQNEELEWERCPDFWKECTDYEEKNMLPKKYRHRDHRKIVSNFHIGLTSVHVNHKSNTITIEHRGNMGNDIDNVKENFDARFGEGSFQHLEKDCNKMIEEGSPDYLYMRYLQF